MPDSASSATEPVNFFDVDRTLDKHDSGQRVFEEAGVCDPEDYFELMEQTHEEGKSEPPEGRGNELMLVLQQRDDTDELEEAARALEPEPRRGLDTSVRALSGDGYQVVAHSAGWKPAIEAKTNGHFDHKIAGELREDGAVLNGKYQKPERIQDYLEQQGIQDPVEEDVAVNFVGDSNTDLEAIRYAAETGGYGIAIGDTIEDARETDTASIYVADHEEHDFTAALLHYAVTGDRKATERFVDEYDLDLSSGYAEPGDLAQNPGEIQEMIEFVEGLGYE